jgi:hypothetical protein
VPETCRELKNRINEYIKGGASSWFSVRKIKQDICQMKVKNWTACVQDREKWKKEVVEKAKTVSS